MNMNKSNGHENFKIEKRYILWQTLFSCVAIFIFILLSNLILEKRLIIYEMFNLISLSITSIMMFLCCKYIILKKQSNILINSFLMQLLLVIINLLSFAIIYKILFSSTVICIIISNIICLLVSYYYSPKIVFSDKKYDLIKVVDYSFVTTFFAIIGIGFLTLFKSPINISYIEYRTLNKVTVPNTKTFLNKTFQDNIEQALADQFVYSQNLRKFSLLHLQFANYKNIDKQLCANRYVYVNPKYAVFNCSDAVVETLPSPDIIDNDITRAKIDALNHLNDYIDTYYYVINRDYAWDFEKNELVYDNYKLLKDNLTGNYHIDRFDINDYDDYYKYFYKTDHHWNYQGSYQGYKDIHDLLGIDEEVIKPVATKKINTKFYGSRVKFSKAFAFSDDFIYYDFDLKEHQEYIDGKIGLYGNYDNYKGKSFHNIYGEVYDVDYAEILYDFNRNDKENLLIIGSSYTNPINRLVASHFNKTYVLDFRFYKKNDGSIGTIKEYIDKNDIDKVLVVASTDVLDNTSSFNFTWEEVE